MRPFFLLLVAPLAGCGGSTLVQGPVSYTSTPEVPGGTGALVERAVVCSDLSTAQVAVRLSNTCILHGWEARPRLGQTAKPLGAGDVCDLPTAHGAIHARIREAVMTWTGAVGRSGPRGLDLAIAADTLDDHPRLVAYHLDAEILGSAGGEACEGALVRPPSSG